MGEADQKDLISAKDVAVTCAPEFGDGESDGRLLLLPALREFGDFCLPQQPSLVMSASVDFDVHPDYVAFEVGACFDCKVIA